MVKSSTSSCWTRQVKVREIGRGGGIDERNIDLLA